MGTPASICLVLHRIPCHAETEPFSHRLDIHVVTVSYWRALIQKSEAHIFHILKICILISYYSIYPKYRLFAVRSASDCPFYPYFLNDSNMAKRAFRCQAFSERNDQKVGLYLAVFISPPHTINIHKHFSRAER